MFEVRKPEFEAVLPERNSRRQGQSFNKELSNFFIW